MSIAWLAGATDRLITADALQAAAVFQLLERGILQVCSFALTAGMFLLVYKFMPNTNTYWRYVWPGAMVTAVLFELAKSLFVFYLSRFTNFENVYGALTPVIVLSLWTYLSGLILIFGAEFSSEYERIRRGRDRGVLINVDNLPTDAGV